MVTIEYEFANVNTTLATLVFVANSHDKRPAQTCDRAPLTQTGFYYTPWQFLRASAGAREYFSFAGDLAIVVRAAGTSPELATQPSARTPALPGRRYLAFASLDGMQAVELAEEDSTAITVVNAPACGNLSCRLAVDWYQGATRIGVTEPLEPGTSATFQARGTLLFQPVSPDNSQQRFTPAELADAVRYRPPPYDALRVTVNFQAFQGRLTNYLFTPPSVAVT